MSAATKGLSIKPRRRNSLRAQVVAWGGLAVLMAFGMYPSHVEAYQVKRIIHGSYTLSGTAEVESIDLSGVLGGVSLDINKTFVLMSKSNASSFNPVTDVAISVDDPTHLLVSRIVAGAGNIEYQVVEFVSGVTVISGLTTVSETQLSKTITLPQTVDVTKTIPIITWRSFRHVSQTTHDEKNNYTAEMTANNVLTLSRTELGTGYHNDISYQVIVFDQDVSVRKGPFNINNSVNAATETSDDGTLLVVDLDLDVTPAGPIANLSKALLLTTISPGNVGGVESNYLVDGYIKDADELEFRRNVNTSNVNGTWHLIEFTNESTTEKTRLTTQLPAATSTYTYNSAVDYDEARVIAWHTTSAGTTTTSTHLDDGLVRAKVQQGTGVTSYVLTRASNAVAAIPSVFMMEFPPVNLVTPNTAIILRVGDVYNISWEHADGMEAQARELKISRDSGGTWSTENLTCSGSTANIGDGVTTNNTHSCDWTVPYLIDSTSIIDAQVRIKLTNTALSARNYDTSNVDFEIKGKLEIQAPNGTEVWSIGDTTKEISWKYWGDMGTCALKYDIASGTGGYSNSIATGVTCGTSTPGSTTVYSWNPGGNGLPDLPYKTLRIKIEDESDAANTYDTSNADFEIRPNIAAEKPATSVQWPVGRCRTIQWATTGTVGNVDIFYKVGVGSYTSVIANNAGYAGNGSNGCEMSDTSNPSPLPCASGKTCYDWTLPPATTQGTTARIKIRKANDTLDEVMDEVPNPADNYFAIVPSIDITSPDTGTELWRVDESHDITWTVGGNSGVTNVDIWYTINSTSPTWVQITNDMAVSGCVADPPCSYPWPIPDGAISDDIKVKVEDYVNPSNVFDISTNPFQVKGALVVTQPQAGVSLLVGNTKKIEWEAHGSIGTKHGNVSIGLSKDTGSSYPPGLVLATNLDPALEEWDWLSIPDETAETCRIKVYVPAYPDLTTGVAGESGTFKIQKLTLTQPNAGGITWEVGDAAAVIQWSRVGASMGNIDIKYALDGTTFVNNVATGVDSGSGSQTWTMADSVIASTEKNTTMKVRLQLASDGTMGVNSANAFTLKGKLALAVPNDGSQVWYANTSQNVTWTTSGYVGTVNVYYSTAVGSAGPFTFIAGPITNCTAPGTCVNSYNWSIPKLAVSENARVKVESASFASDISTVSASAYKVKPAFTAVTGPTASEVWNVGETTRKVKWTASGAITDVQVEYKCGTDPYTLVVASDSGHGDGANEYTWAAGVADEKAEDCYIRISDANNLSHSIVSPIFSIRPVITATQPFLNTDVVVAGTTQPIRWSTTGTRITNVDLDYSVDGGAYQQIAGATAVPNAQGTTYTWNNVPNAISQNVQIRITDASTPANANVIGYSPIFHIVGDLILTDPTGSENWAINSSQNITWNFVGSIASVKVYLDRNSGGDGYPTLLGTVGQTGGSGSAQLAFPWAGQQGVTNTARVKVTDASNESVVYDASTADFSLIGGFNITAPENGAVVVAEGSTNITWDPGTITGITKVKLEYTTNDSSYTTITTNAPNNGTFNWSPIPGGTLSTNCRIKISQFEPLNANAVDSGSGSPFVIRGRFDVTSPNAGTESWTVGTAQDIKFLKYGNITSAKIEYSHNNGSDWTSLVGTLDVSGAAGGTEYTWNWPLAAGSTALSGNGTTGFTGLVRVTDNGNALAVDSSNSAFEVKGTVSLLTPDASSITMVVGPPSTYNITWGYTGLIANVEFHYSTTGGVLGGGTYPGGNSIGTVAANYAQPLVWSVPDAIGSNLRVRMRDANNPNIWDESTNTFTIKGTAAVTAPNGSSVWISGDTHQIVWDRTGSIGNVDFHYSVNDGTWGSIATGIASPNATNNTYDWPLPDGSGGAIVSSNVKVRLTGANVAAAIISPAFQVKGKLILLTPDPNGVGLSYTLSDTMNMAWTAKGDIGNVKVEYTKNGTDWVTITNTAAQNGPYGFTMDATTTNFPEEATAGAKVRISDADEASVSAVSINAFTVKPLLAVSNPVGDEALVVGSPFTITWNKKGTNVLDVDIFYSTDSGGSYPNQITASTANDGTQAWAGNIPDNIQAVKNMKIRIRSLPTSDPWAVSAFSNGLFQIIGAVVMTTPNDSTGIKWRVGSQDNAIEWTATGSIINVKLEYATAGAGGPWTTLIGSAPSNSPGLHNYEWDIPNNFTIVKDNFRLRASDAANSSVIDTATANSSILAGFDLDHPTAGDVWVAETSYSIEWTTPTAGVPGNVKIEYNLDDAQGWKLLPENDGTPNDGIVPNSGNKSWTLGTTLSTNAQVRITDPSDADSLFPGTGFQIRGSLTVTAPNTGSESWEVNTLHDITWTKKGAITAVNLEYTTDADAGTVVWEDLIDGDSNPTQNIDVSGAGPYTFNWKIPDIAGITSTKVKVRVLDAANELTVNDASNTKFTIKGRVELLTPDGGQTMTVGVPYTITGNVYGPITGVKLYYSTNGGSTWTQMPGGNCDTDTVSGGAFSCDWSVLDIIDTDIRVRVEDAANSLVFDESAADNTVKGSATITAPTGSSVWIAGVQSNIVWDRNGTIGNVDLYYNVNNGTYQTIATGVASPSPTGNSFPWDLPTTAIVSGNVKVKVTGSNLVADVISPAFQVKGKITMLTPDPAASGLVFTLGDTMNVTWSVAGDIGPVRVEYFDGSQWNLVTATAPQAGPYPFDLDAPVTELATIGAKMRISDADDGTVKSESVNAFTVKPYLAVTAPAGDEALVVGSAYTILWDKISSNIADVKIEYSTDSGSSYPNVILANTPNDGSQAWPSNIPDNIQAVKNMKIKISTLPTNDPWAVTAVSNGLFQITGALVMTTPNDSTGIKWRVGSQDNLIEWTATGSIANVKLEYSNAGAGGPWNNLISTTPSGPPGLHNYAWDIPNNQTIVKDTFRIRVSDAANSNVVDTATANSSILAGFTLVHPTAGDVWVAETSYSIEWSTPTAGVPGNVKIEYNLDDGQGWQLLPENDGTPNDGIVPNSGAKSWTLGTTLSTNAKVRISDPADSDSNFEGTAFLIRGSLTLTAPNTGAESWEIATLHDITWTKKGAITAVNLEYTTDADAGTVVWEDLVDGDAKPTQGIDVSGAGPYAFNWKIPDIAGITSTKVKVRVLDAANELTVNDASNVKFTIKGRVELSNPNGGQTLAVGDLYTIDGTVFGPISAVKVEYSTNGGSSYDFVAEGCGVSGVVTVSTGAFSCSWSVPDKLGSNLKVRVSDNANPLVLDVSTSTFSIKGSASITAPTGTSIWIAGAQHNIVWDRNGTIGNVDLYYNVNNGTYQTIATGVASPDPTGNSYGWDLPTTAIVSGNVKVKITGANLIADVISPAFQVKGKLTLQTPDPNASGLIFTLGDTMNVTWSVAGDIGPVRVEYFDGSQWNLVTATAPQAGPQAFDLNTPITTLATNGGKIRISDADDATVSSTSVNAFLVKPYVAVTAPAGDEALVVGSAYTILWDKISSNIADVKIEYSTDSGSSYPNVILASTPNDGTQAWPSNIPDNIQAVKNMKIKLSTLPTGDPWAVTAVSNGLFQITGALVMTTPNDSTGIKWRVGSQDNLIEWTATGSIANVKLEYSNAGAGGPWNNLISTTPSGPPGLHNYAWDIPNNQTIVKDAFRIRVSDAANSNVIDTATANSSILAGFTIAHPTAGDVWVAESSYAIEWTTPTAGVPGNVKIEYNLDDGQGWQLLPENDGTPNDGIVPNSATKNWTLGSILSTNAKVRISDPTDVDSIQEGTGFRIRGDLTLTAPNTGTESWEINTVHAITWTKKGNITAANLEYTTDADAGTVVWEDLIDADSQPTQNIDISGAGPYTFNWKIPDVAGITSTKVKVRVLDAANELTVNDASNAKFTIKGRLELLTPNGGQTLTVGVPYAITGDVFGPITGVKLFYSTNGGSTWTQMPGGNCDTDTVSGGAFSCDWSVLDIIDTDIRVRVEDAANSLVFDESVSDITVKGSASITAPTGSSVWIAGDQHNIVWDRNGTIGNVDLFYNVNNGTYQSIASGVASPNPTGNSFGWDLPSASIVSSNVKVKVTGANLVADVISPAFQVKGKLTMLSPDPNASGLIFTLGDTMNVTWSVAGDIGPVRVEYFDGSQWNLVTATAAQAGPQAFDLDAPVTTLATIGAKMRISDADDATVKSESANAFTVKPYVAVTAPAGNEALLVGSAYTITWDQIGSNVADVKIEYSTDSGSTYPNVILASTPNDGSQAWPSGIPDNIQSVKNMKIKLSTLPTGDPWAVTAVSNGLFQIVGGLEMVVPNDSTGIKWRVGSNANEIKWNATGSIATVKLEYSNNSGTDWATLVSTTPSGAGSNKTYSWNIPNNQTIVKDTLRIRVLDAANTNVLDAANATSSILAGFDLDHPTAGDVWVAETTYPIEWSTPVAGVPANVKLEYDLGGGWQNLPENDGTPNDGIVPNTGTKSWALGTALSTNAKVRISDPADTNSILEGTAFRIRGSLTVTAPNTGTESWEVETLHDITWTKKGAITAVNLEYTTDADAGTVVWEDLVDGDAKPTQGIDVTGVGPYTFNWKIPDIAGIATTKARIRVLDASDELTVNDASNANFTIKGRVELANPNGGGGQTLTVGQLYTIDGTVFGPITAVKVEYSTNSGSTYDFVAEGCGVSGVVTVSTGAFSCSWSVPDKLGSGLKVRVSDNTNPLVVDESDNTFAIKGSATITSPTGTSIPIAGESFNIVWDRNGTIGNVDLSYSVNNGTYQSIATGVGSPNPTGNTYGWPVPTTAIVSNNVKVKVDNANLLSPAISPQFQVKGKLTLLTPDPNASGLAFNLTDQLNVSWNVAGDIGPVKVEYYDGSAWNTVTTTAPQAGPHPFNLDTPVTTLVTVGAKVRISDADDATVTAQSVNAFMVKPTLQVTAPTANDELVVGDSFTITWAPKGTNIANVLIEYSTDSGSTYPNVILASTQNDGSQAWPSNVPDNIQSVKNMKVRISTLPTSDPWAITAVSSGLFQIIGRLEMATPNDSSGIKWRVGTANNEIKWNATGSVVNVRLEYSLNGVGGPWNQIVASAPSGVGNNKTYSWNIPNAVALAKDTFRIRVLDAANTNVYDIATANSSMLANFTYVHPLVGEVWVATTDKDIEWTTPTAGVPANVKIDYKLNDIQGWQSITASAVNSGIAPWTLPSGLSQAAKVRLADVNDPVDSIVESADFKIRGEFTMTAPNTGQESWGVDTVQQLTWTKKGDITTAKLQFSNNGDDPPSYIALVDGNGLNTQSIDVSGSGPFTFNWRIPDIAGIITTTARIRVVDSNDSTVSDPSNNNFTIRGNVTLVNPNGGQTLTVGVPYTITGNVFGPIPSVKLFYSTNGTTYDYAVEGCATVGVSAGTFSCDWSVPDRIGTNVKVRVEDSGNPLVFDTSDNILAIKGQAIITAPIGSPVPSVWIAGDDHDILWDRNGSIGNVDLYYSVNDGAYTSIASNVASPNPTGNTFTWTLPDGTGGPIVSSNVKVKIEGANLVASAISPAFVVKGKLTLNYPDAAGIAVTLGDTIGVSWNVAGDIGPVKVEYYNGTSWTTATSAAPQAGPYALLLDSPVTTVATTGAKVRISDPDDASVTDTSTNAFLLKPLLQVTYPAGGETFVVGSSPNIQWNYKGSNVSNVEIRYSKDGGLNYNDVVVNAASTANDGVHAWAPIPDDIQSVANMKIKISTLPLSDPWAVTSISNGLFKIVGSLTLTTPQGSDRWGVGTTHDIKWQRTGSIANIRLAYSTDGVNYNNSIVSTYPGGNGDTGYAWDVPNVAGIVSDNVTVRISDVNDATVYNISPIFKITPTFDITAPVINERVMVSRSYNILWDRLGQNLTVNIYYSKDGFTGPGILIATAAPNTGAYTWNVPDDAGLASGPVSVALRVAWPTDETVFDTSPAFWLVSGFTMVSPNTAGDKWDVGSTQTIRWTATSAYVPTVKLHYSLNAGTSYPFELTASTSNAAAADVERTWSWPALPDAISDQFKVRVTANNDPGALDESDFSGKIKAFFQVLNPSASGIILTVNQAYNITWDWNGTVTLVRLDYTKDDSNWNNIPDPVTGVNTANDGVFEWTVPDDISDTVKIRVRSSADVDAYDISNNNFKVRGNFQVLTPTNGSEQFQIGYAHDITWTTTGNITAVDLVAYSTLVGDLGFPHTEASPYVIATNLANNPNSNTTYSWNPVPDMASPRIRVKVINRADTTVYDASNNDFKIQGSFTIVYPSASGIAMAVGNTATITWNMTGSSITQAKISYSTAGSGGPWTAIIESEGTPNDGIVGNDGSIDWVIPNAISETLFLKIEDPNDSTVFDLSNNAFKINGNLVFVTPTAGMRWVTNENQIVSWTTTGSINAVNLIYSIDDFQSSTPVVSSYANPQGLNTYGWVIPNTLSANAKLRVIDANDPTVYATTPAFQIDHYQITFEVRDLLSNNHLDTLTVAAINNSNNNYTWNASGLNSPITQGVQAGAWVATFSRNEYGDQSVGFVADQDQTVQVFMETEVVHIWQAVTDLAFDPTNDTVAISSTLQRDGIIVPGAVYCQVRFFDAQTLIKDFVYNGTPDINGFYAFAWTAPTGLVASKVYNVITTVRIATGGNFNSPRTFTITEVQKLQDVQDFVAERLDVSLSEVDENIQEKLDDQTDIITDTLDDQTDLIEEKLDEQTDAIEETLTSFEEKADEQITELKTEVTNIKGASDELNQRSIELEATNKKFAGELLLPGTLLVGDKNVKLQYQAFPGLQPMITIIALDQSNKENVVVDHEPMVPTATRPEVYEYVIEKVSVPPYTPGKFVSVTVEAEVFNDPSLDGPVTNIESGSFIVESTTLSTLEGLVAGQSGLKDLVQSVLSNMRAVQASLSTDNNVTGLLQALNRKIDALPREVAKAIAAQGDTKDMKETLNKVAEQMRSLAGENMGLDFTQIVGKALDESSSMQDVRKKTDAVQGTTEVMQILLEKKYGGIDAPVVHVLYQ